MLELQPPPEGTSHGIFQSDVLIRYALKAIIADIKANPWLIDYVFSGMAQDALTWREYGAKNVQAARDWFLKTEIPVVAVHAPDELKGLALTVGLLDSTEMTAEATLGDVHYDVSEENDSQWPVLAGPVNFSSYDPVTGKLVLDEALDNDIVIFAGMYVVDTLGRPHEIIDVEDDLTFYVSPNTVADFRGAVFKPARPAYVVGLESSSFRETYRIGVHAPGEPQKLQWLHSIIVFGLLRYKQAFLECRGFERSTIQSSDFSREPQYETEPIYGRYISVTGYVRHVWPKNVSQAIGGVVVQPLRVSVGVTSDTADSPGDVRVVDAGLDPDEQLWVGNKDILDNIRR